MQNPLSETTHVALRLSPVEAPAGLLHTVFARIHREQARLARVRAALYSVGTLASLGVGVFVTLSLARSLRESGFYEYVSLALSGDSLFLVYWRELSLSILESVPTVTLLTLLVVLLVLVWTSANTFTNVRKIVRTA
ncbi:hypothetical protein BH11PAT2_BH11PAT2_01950 [soil metagenome]